MSTTFAPETCDAVTLISALLFAAAGVMFLVGEYYDYKHHRRKR